MEINNQNTKKFYARRNIILMAICCVIFLAVTLITLISTPKLWTNNLTGFMILAGLMNLILSICQYFMEYITIGEDFITYKPALLRTRVIVPFDQITSIEYQKTKVIINYGHNSSLKISIYSLVDNARKEILDILHTVLKDK
jgi:hypothetical protein